MRLGEVLVGQGIITSDVLRRALDIQRRSGGPIGPIIVALGGCTQSQIDHAWVEHVIRPAVRAALDQASGGLLERTPGVTIRLTRIELTTAFFEQPIADNSRGPTHRRDAVIDGVAELRGPGGPMGVAGGAVGLVGGASAGTLAASFILDPSTHEAIIDDQTRMSVAEWLALLAAQPSGTLRQAA